MHVYKQNKKDIKISHRTYGLKLGGKWGATERIAGREVEMKEKKKGGEEMIQNPQLLTLIIFPPSEFNCVKRFN